jgi:lysophospholipase L1-like esterase
MRKLVMLLAVALAAVALAEAGLRLAGHIYLRRLYTSARDATVPKDALNVVCLGESSTAGLWVEPENSYPAQLEAGLRALHGERVHVIVPPHVGQNTSQMANRVADYMALYRPRLVVVMAGYNNEWSLAESNLGRFLKARSVEALRARLLIALDGVRVFRVVRHGALRLWSWASARGDAYLDANPAHVWGHPELVRLPPAAWVFELAAENRDAMVELWRSDVGRIVDEARRGGAKVLLMTYHLNPTYLPAAEFVRLASEKSLPLVRNDLAFQPLVDDRTIDSYLMHDHWHPSARGYRLIAANALAKIQAEDLLGLGKGAAEAPQPLAGARDYPVLAAGLSLLIGLPEAGLYLGSGWSSAEGWFRWTDAERAELFFRLDPVAGRTLQIALQPFVVDGRLESQRMTVVLNGRQLAVLQLDGRRPLAYRIQVPAGVLAATNTLVLETPDARSPASLGVGHDTRKLGVSVGSIRLE